MQDRPVRPNPYQPPREPPLPVPPAVERDGKLVRLARTTKLPRVCVGCGTDHEVLYAKQEFSFTPAPVYALGLFGLLGVAFAKTLARTARLRVPRCASCKKLADLAKVVLGPVIIAWLVVGLGAATAAGNGAPGIGLGILIVGTALAGAAFWSWARPRLWAAHIDETTITLKGIHPAALDRISA